MNNIPISLKEKIANITMWKRGDTRAPHKPLLLLLMFSEMLHEDKRYVLFKEIESELEELLSRYSPPRKSHHPEYPFWRLVNDGIWELTPEEPLESYLNQSRRDPGVTVLREHNIRGGFTEPIYNQLSDNTDLIYELTEMLLDQHFPESLHNDICESLGLKVAYSTTQTKKRDPAFRRLILKRYDYQCAVCGYSIWLMGQPVGLEAAHIKWHQIGGPDAAENGLALCALHHKLFDFGAFTLDESYRTAACRTHILVVPGNI